MLKVAAKIDHTSYDSTLRVKAGQDFHLEILYYGEPSPKVHWSTGSKVITALIYFMPN